MKDISYISQFNLEMYHLDAVSEKERRVIEAALASDRELRGRYEALEELDREIRGRFPPESEILPADFREAVPERRKTLSWRRAPGHGRFLAKKPIWGIGAAALLLCLFSTLFYLRKPPMGEWSEIPLEPGRARGEMKTEFSVSVIIPARSRLLFDQDQLKEGDRVELEYSAQPGDNYGVLFSINGNSKVTLHYPYSTEDSPELTTGRRIVLESTYPMDDAPDFEVFYFVVSRNPLDAGMILKTAGELAAGRQPLDPLNVIGKISTAFPGCEVQSITIRK